MIHLLAATVGQVIAAGGRLTDMPTHDGAGAQRLVAPEDRTAASAKHAQADQCRTLAGRLALRLLASRVLGRSPATAASLPVDRTCDHCGAPHGRPRIDGLSASTSTSGDLVLAAVGDESVRVGVDVERVPVTLWHGFDEYVLHPAERSRLPGGDDGVRERLQVWTDKEAVLKSVGLGLRVAPAAFRIDGAPSMDTAAAAGTTAGTGTGAAAPLLARGWRAVVESDERAVAAVSTTTVEVGAEAVASLAATRPQTIRSCHIGEFR